MDTHSLDILEFDRIRQLVAADARCSLGRELARGLQPSGDADWVIVRAQEFRQFARLAAERGLPPFGGITDVRPLVRAAVPPHTLEPEDCGALADALRGLAALRLHLRELGAEFDLIAAIVEPIGDFRAIADRIDAIIDDRGRVRDDASPRLSRIRGRQQELRQELHVVFERLLRQSSITRLLQYPSSTFHDDRMVLPLKAEHRGRIPGVIHRSSDSGQTLFVEPTAAVELNNALIGLAQDEHDEIGRILWDLTHLVHLNQAALLDSLDRAAQLDLLTAKLVFAQRYRMTVPGIEPVGPLQLRNARHPLLLAMADERRAAGDEPPPVVPISLRLGEDFDVLIVTGPNTGGKTVALKTVGLLALMSQCGLPIPAEEGSTLPVFDDVLVDIGDEQSLQQSLSTFSAHLARTLEIVRRGSPRTLVLIDELGAGTDPDDGAALGRAIVARLLELACPTIITTHLGALKTVAYEEPRVDNAAVQFDYGTLQPTYELRIGEPGNSNALIIAARLGMPTEMVSAAQRFLDERDTALARAIAGTLESRRSAEQARQAAEETRAAAERRLAEARSLQAQLEAERTRYARWLERIMNLRPGESVRVKRFDREGRVVFVNVHKQLVRVAIGAIEIEVPLSEIVVPD
ncbi:MAG: DNA strand exchange inhibitor protein [Phycisphaerae bacterium]|nr:DNA strand exchange inhibitor protein [Phycisphaerae bacterium]